MFKNKRLIDRKRATLVVALTALTILAVIGASVAIAAGSATLGVSPDRTIDSGETTTFTVVLENADGGVGAAAFDVSLENPSVGSISSVDIGGNPSSAYSSVDIASDGSDATIEYATADTDDAGPVTIATITVEGKSPGTSMVSLSGLDGADVVAYDEAGAGYDISSIGSSTLTVEEPTTTTQPTTTETPTTTTTQPTTTETPTTTTEKPTTTTTETPTTTTTETPTTTTTTTPPANEQPGATFTVDPASADTGQSVNFDASESSDPDGSIVSYEWEFDDGSTATGATVSHAFDSAGEYTVKLTVTDDTGATDTTTRTVSVDPAPVLDKTPHDLDGDGLYEDVNGDGVFDVVDVQALFAHRKQIAKRPDAAAFNFDDNTYQEGPRKGEPKIDVVDVQRLFRMVID